MIKITKATFLAENAEVFKNKTGLQKCNKTVTIHVGSGLNPWEVSANFWQIVVMVSAINLQCKNVVT